MAGIAVVFDFDKTIIEHDSDNWVVDGLGATDLFNQLLPTMPWNPLMDRMMDELHAQGITLEDIKELLRRVPIHPRIAPAIKRVYDLGCDLRIVSDANVFFIETILDHLGIRDCFSEIYSNPSFVDEEGRLRISPLVDFQSSPHGCSLCPPNMCKGLIMERIQEAITKEGKKRVIYLGDGAGDYCPSLKLEEGDLMMPRMNFPVWDLICENRNLLRAEIQEWNDGEDMEQILIKHVENSSCCSEEITNCKPMLSVDCKLESIPVATTAAHEGFSKPLRVNQ